MNKRRLRVIVKFSRAAEMLAETAFAVAGTLNVSFLRFCPESWLFGSDNK